MTDRTGNLGISSNPLITRPYGSQSGSLDWSQHRNIITHLYIHQNYKLKDVQSYMKLTFGFRATPRMYKTRFRQWKLRKNINDELRESGSLRDRISSTGTVSKACQKRLQNQVAKQLPSPASTQLMYLNSGERAGEIVLQQIKIYYEEVVPTQACAPPRLHHYSSDHQITTCKAPNLNTRMALSHSWSPDVWDLCNTNLMFRQKADLQSAYITLKQICIELDQLIRSTPQDIFRKIFMVLGARAWSNFPSERRIILGRAEGISAEAFGPQYPLTVALSQLHEDDCLEVCAEPALRYLVQKQPSPRGWDDEEVFLSRDSFAVALIRQQDYGQAERFLEDAISKTTASLGQSHEYTRLYHRRLANMYMHQERRNHAAHRCELILKLDKLAADTSLMTGSMQNNVPGGSPVLGECSIRTMQDLAYLSAQQGDNHGCERWMLAAARAVCLLFSFDQMQKLLHKNGCGRRLDQRDPLGSAYVVLKRCSSVWCHGEDR